MDIESVYGDTFRACKVNSIAYRSYSLRPSSQPQQEETVMGGTLRRVEVVLRRDFPQILTSLSASGRELWVYRLQEDEEDGADLVTSDADEPSPEPRTKTPVPDWAPEWAPMIDEILDESDADCVAQGVFLPPFTSGAAAVNRGTSMSMNALSKASLSSLSSAHNSTARLSSFQNLARDALGAYSDRSKYGPLVRAIELKLLASLLRKGDVDQFEAFGPRAALSTGDGAVVRVHPILQQDGTLDVRITKQLASLVQQPILSTKLSTSMIWLLPQGKPARIMTSLRYEDAVEPANRARARALFYLLNTYFVTNVTMAQLEASLWMRVSSLETGGDLLWPVVLIRASTLTSHIHNLAPSFPRGTPRPGDAPPGSAARFDSEGETFVQSQTRSPLRHSRKPQRAMFTLLKQPPYEVLADSMVKIRRELKSAEIFDEEAGTDAADSESVANILHQTLNRPMAPPPSPRPATALPSRASTVAPTAAPTVAASPVGLPSASATPNSGVAAHFYPTPAYNASTYGTPAATTPALVDQDDWMDVERDNENEVGDADFNFFDLPLNEIEQHPDSMSVKSEVSPTRSRSISGQLSVEQSDTTVVDTSGFAIEPKPEPDLDVDEMRSPKRTKFASLKFHASDLDSKYSDGGRFHMPSFGGEEQEGQEDFETKAAYWKGIGSKDLKFIGDESSTSEDETDSDHENIVVDDEVNDTWQDPMSAHESEPQVEHLSDAEHAWLLSIKYEEASYLPIDASKFTTFRFLLTQIVFDGGLLSEIYEAPVISGITTVAPDHIIKRMPWRLLQRPLSYQNSQGNQCSKAPSSGGPPGSPVSNQASQQPRKVQLLSPPLAAVRRGDYSLRARISILRFWRLLSLAPPIPETPSSEARDVSDNRMVHCILLTIDTPAVMDAARHTLDSLKVAFEGCRLGSMDLPSFGQVDQGLMPVEADLAHTSGDAIGELFLTGCTKLKKQLQTLTQYNEDSNLLIFMCYPPASLRGGTLTAIVPFQLAQGFANIQASYPSAQWMLSGLDVLVSRWGYDHQISELELEQLAMRVYSRFPNFPQLFRLASLVPHSLGLQYSEDMPQYLMEDEPVLHVAYLVVEGRWCIASWSDQWARKLELDMFQLNDTTERSLQHIFDEILKRSQNIARSIKDRSGWRFSISKLEAMTTAELAVWERLLQPGTIVTLMDIPYPRGLVMTDLGLSDHQSRSQKPAFAPSEEPNTAASPTTGTVPSPLTTAQQGSARIDGVIVDANDEIYGISVEAPKPGICRFAAAWALGYLVRPREDGYMTMETRLLKAHGLSILPRVIMSRVVGQFRRLASLSEFMGITSESTLVPWHVIALLKLEAATLKLNM